MGFNCCEKTFSCLFIFFNVIFSVLGLGTLALGIYLKADPSASELLNVVEIEDGAHYLENSGWIIIGFGSLVLLVCCCGCVGASTKSKCLLGLYIAFAVVIVIGELAALAITVMLVVRIDDVNSFQANLTLNVQNEYKKNTTNEFRNSWDYLQKTFKCCGVSDHKDYDTVYTGTEKGKLPASCCTTESANAINSTGNCQFLFKQGCFQLLKEKVHEYSTALFIFEAVVIAVTIIGIIIAACLCRRTGEKV
ncbi:CD82 antigen-like [Haliotis rufescens]|uniref:CD82 antigen-like n=1 Tax=Haliotis rufescens TaxID=6454 RepID=UPI00201FAC74|nr:CD82 antigen-like [Haliotis rufescens]XP_046326888.2 CD82 antigen-like [Haliotis rufescens]